MPYKDAKVFLDAAVAIAAEPYGMPLTTLEERFGRKRRWVQRLVAAMRRDLPDLEEIVGHDGRKLLKLRRQALCNLVGVSAEQLAALDLAIDRLDASAADVGALKRLRDDIRSLLPSSTARRLETDREAILEAQGFVVRPGPRITLDQALDEMIVQAVKASVLVEFDYMPKGKQTALRRRAMPLGILSGMRRYLVARPVDRDKIHSFRLDRMTDFALTKDGFERPEDFDLRRHAHQGFGAFIEEQEVGPVVWRFAPPAAEAARDFLFHPSQRVEPQEDGSLIVRFEACGHLEMAWHLYAWGNKVEVVEPEALRSMVENHRRSDFPAFP